MTFASAAGANTPVPTPQGAFAFPNWQYDVNSASEGVRPRLSPAQVALSYGPSYVVLGPFPAGLCICLLMCLTLEMFRKPGVIQRQRHILQQV